MIKEYKKEKVKKLRDSLGQHKNMVFANYQGMTVIEVGPLLASAPDRERFLCLDGIHMTEPYHRLMARQWLEFLVGARGARLAAR